MGNKLLGIVKMQRVFIFILLLWFATGTSRPEHRRPGHPYPHSIVDIPISLGVGSVRTPEFYPVAKWYWIMVQVEKPLPFAQMICMMGVTSNSFDKKACSREDPLLQADWALLEDGQVVSHGTTLDGCACMFPYDYIFKFLGKFSAESGKHYVLIVKFTKDGTPLDIAKPHLIITQIGKE